MPDGRQAHNIHENASAGPPQSRPVHCKGGEGI